MNTIEISAIGIIICTAVNFIFFILILYLTLTVQGWKQEIDENMSTVKLVLKVLSEYSDFSRQDKTPKHRSKEKQDEANRVRVLCILQRNLNENKISYEESNRLTIWLNNLVNNQMER